MNVRGFTIPLTPSGQASVAAGPPWHFAGDVIQVDYHVDEGPLSDFLPPGVELDLDDPGLVQVAFSSMSAVSAEIPGQHYLAPDDVNFNECLVKIRARVAATPGWFVSHSWVTNDVSLVRGFVQGFPKRLGKVAMTSFHSPLEQTGGRRPGARLGGVVETPDGLRVRVLHFCEERGSPGDVPALPFYLRRHFPSLQPNGAPAVDEIVSPIVSEAEDLDVWTGPAEIEASGSPEAAALVAPIDRPRSRSFSSALTITGSGLVRAVG